MEIQFFPERLSTSYYWKIYKKQSPISLGNCLSFKLLIWKIYQKSDSDHISSKWPKMKKIGIDKLPLLFWFSAYQLGYCHILVSKSKYLRENIRKCPYLNQMAENLKALCFLQLLKLKKVEYLISFIFGILAEIWHFSDFFNKLMLRCKFRKMAGTVQIFVVVVESSLNKH